MQLPPFEYSPSLQFWQDLVIILPKNFPSLMIILGIETSCDETSAAVVRDGEVKSNIIASQLFHEKYGGVVPELASRAHMKLIVQVVNEALEKAGVGKQDLGGVAATHGPGLIGSILVGLNFGKAFAYGLGIPFVGVNHMEAHLFSNFLTTPDDQPEFPFVCLTVSGGHTQLIYVRKPFEYLMLGQTRDDAAGEAFDKVAKMLGIGYPGGPEIDRLARQGNPMYVRFPRSYLEQGSFDFSFSGLKTAVLYYLRDHGLLRDSRLVPSGGSTKIEHSELSGSLLPDLCASFQAAVVDVLAEKTIRAAEQYKVKDIGVAGGVSANSELRRRMKEEGQKSRFRVHFPKTDYCTDNGAMIAYVGWLKLQAGIPSLPDEVTAVANLQLCG
jgi:N6-L-threonylcarbamoyladenine synthase